jgi:hypothetical protein
MFRVLRLAHVLGLVLSLGSILTFLVVSAVIEGTDVRSIALGRRIISAGTNALTIPGLGLLAVGGIGMVLLRSSLKERLFQLKLLLLVLVGINGALFVAPAVKAATEIAIRSEALGRLLAEYRPAYARESMFGAANVVLLLAAVLLGVWRAGTRAHLHP